MFNVFYLINKRYNKQKKCNNKKLEFYSFLNKLVKSSNRAFKIFHNQLTSQLLIG